MQAEGAAGPTQEPDAGLDPGTPGSRPGPRAGAKPLSPRWPEGRGFCSEGTSEDSAREGVRPTGPGPGRRSSGWQGRAGTPARPARGQKNRASPEAGGRAGKWAKLQSRSTTGLRGHLARVPVSGRLPRPGRGLAHDQRQVYAAAAAGHEVQEALTGPPVPAHVHVASAST